MTMSGVAAEALLRLPVKVRGIRLGWPVDAILDADGGRALGLDVLCGDDVHRFLPLAAAELRDDAIVVESALTLLTDAERRYYRSRGSALRDRTDWRDIVFGAGWEVEELLADDHAHSR